MPNTARERFEGRGWATNKTPNKWQYKHLKSGSPLVHGTCSFVTVLGRGRDAIPPKVASCTKPNSLIAKPSLLFTVARNNEKQPYTICFHSNSIASSFAGWHLEALMPRFGDARMPWSFEASRLHDSYYLVQNRCFQRTWILRGNHVFSNADSRF